MNATIDTPDVQVDSTQSMDAVIDGLQTFDVNMDSAQPLDVEIGATPEQLLPLIDTNNKLATANKTLIEQVVPTIVAGLQSKSVSAIDIEQEVKADDGYLGLSKVTVAPAEKDVRIINRRANDDDDLYYYMEDIVVDKARSDYKAIIACDYYKDNYTTIALSGADAYLTSDGDFYTSAATHTWHDSDDPHVNRWIAYYFVESGQDFVVAKDSVSPHAIIAKGEIGGIIVSVAGVITNVSAYGDDSSIEYVRFTTTNAWGGDVFVKGVKILDGGYLIYNNSSAQRVTLGVEKITGAASVAYTSTAMRAVLLPNLTELTGKSAILYRCETAPLQVIRADKLKKIDNNSTFMYYVPKNLPELTLPELEEIAGASSVARCQGGNSGVDLLSISLPKLKRCNGCVIEVYNSTSNKFTTLDLPLLQEISGGAVVYSYDENCLTALTTLSLPALTTITSYVAFGENTALSSITLPKLETVSIKNGNNSSHFFAGNLKEVHLPALKTLNFDCSYGAVFESQTLEVVDCPELETITGATLGGLLKLATLTTITFPKLKSCTKQILTYGCSVDEVNLPALEVYNNSFCGSENAPANGGRCKRIYLGCKGNKNQMIRLTSWSNFSGDVEDIEIGDGALQILHFSAYTGLTRENMVNHILVKLGDNTGQAAVTLSLGSTNLAKLTDEDKAIATAKNWTLA